MMVADNFNESEVDERIEKLTIFISAYAVQINSCLANKIERDDCGFSYFQKEELSNFYYFFCSCDGCIKNNNAELAFLHFSSFLEVLKRMPKRFEELNSFDLLRFSVKDHYLVIDYSNFDESEPLLKFVREFNELRNRNYKEKYKKEQ